MHLFENGFMVDTSAAKTADRKANRSLQTDSWHGLGTPIDFGTSLGVDDIPALAGWLHDYLHLPLYFRHPLTGEMIESEDRVQVLRSDNHVQMGSVGKGYTQLPFEEVLSAIRPLVEEGELDPHTGGVLDEGRVTFLTLRPRSGAISEPVKGDPHELYLFLVQGHCGQLPVRLGWTQTRMVCWNTVSAGMAVATEKASVRHTRNVAEHTVTAVQALAEARRNFEETQEVLAALSKKNASAKDRETFFRLVAQAKIDGELNLDAPRDQFHGKTRARLESLDEALESAPGARVAPGTIYSVWNAATAFLSHSGDKRTPSDRKVLDLWSGRKGTRGEMLPAAWGWICDWAAQGTLSV